MHMVLISHILAMMVLAALFEVRLRICPLTSSLSSISFTNMYEGSHIKQGKNFECTFVIQFGLTFNLIYECKAIDILISLNSFNCNLYK